MRMIKLVLSVECERRYLGLAQHAHALTVGARNNALRIVEKIEARTGCSDPRSPAYDETARHFRGSVAFHERSLLETGAHLADMEERVRLAEVREGVRRE